MYAGTTGDLYRVQAVLRGQRIGQCRVAHRDTEHAPAPIATLQHGVKYQRLVGAVKGSQTQVHDADRAVARVAWHVNSACGQGR
jgi:hypothetical protein